MDPVLTLFVLIGVVSLTAVPWIILYVVCRIEDRLDGLEETFVEVLGSSDGEGGPDDDPGPGEEEPKSHSNVIAFSKKVT
jgi:hypothetical protein